MIQSPLQTHDLSALHVAIIMDGNGRWATARGRPRTEGHRAGADAVRRTVEAATRLGLGTLTLFAFSSDNWHRPAHEVSTLMELFRRYLDTEVGECAKHGIRLSVLGRRDRLSSALRGAVEAAEAATAKERGLHLRLAVDYSSRDAILWAATRCTSTEGISRESFSRLLCGHDGGPPVPDVDLLVRTGGEHRLSDFLLWECAYAELVFTHRMWPEFDAEDLREAILEFLGRDRRFGRILSER